MRSRDFDPYHRWLGIPSEEQPADYYRLLGLSLFESDPEVIRDAAERQIAHVRSYALGQHGQLSQNILNELSKAKACLLNESEKMQYDRALRRKTESQRPEPVSGSSPVFGASQPIRVGVNVRGAGRSAARKRSNQRRRQSPCKAVAALVPIILGGAGGICVAIVLLWVIWKKDPLGVINDGQVDASSKEIVASAAEKSNPPRVKSTEPTRARRAQATPKRSPLTGSAKTTKSLPQASSNNPALPKKSSPIPGAGTVRAAASTSDSSVRKTRTPATSVEEDKHGKLNSIGNAPSKLATTQAGYPSIAGEWLEANSLRVVITQNVDQFTATCAYKNRDFGEIQWECKGTISKDGWVKATLIHTQAPDSYFKQVPRIGQLSPDSRPAWACCCGVNVPRV
jgi:hypothetical protein